jgi:hypothetical protein
MDLVSNALKLHVYFPVFDAAAIRALRRSAQADFKSILLP